MDIIKKINAKTGKGLWEVLPTLTAKQIEEVVKIAADKYYNTDSPVLSDEAYDVLIDKLELLKPKSTVLKSVGVPEVSGKVKLPFWMGSMNKVKTGEKFINNWVKTYHGPYVVSDKLDGISCLAVIKKGKITLYTRGNGEYGRNVSHLIDLINLSIDIDNVDDMVVRGELIMSKKKFEKYAGTMANARNMVAGIVNSKPTSVKKKHAADVDFVVYEIVTPIYKPSKQMTVMEECDMNVVYNKTIEHVNLDTVASILKKRKKSSVYEIDGIIITDDKKHSRNTSGNPEYSFAYKGLTESAKVKVLDVIWTESKDGVIVPRIKYEKVRLSQAELQFTAGFNAKYIVDNGIGKNAIITVIRSGDVIPYILNVDKSVEPQMPAKKNYVWDKTHVNIVLRDPNVNSTVIIKRLTKFVTDIGVDNMSEGIVTRFYEAGYDTIPKIISLKVSDMLKVEGVKDTLANKLYKNLQTALTNLTLLKLMVASNAFGRGFGERKIKKILDKYPSIVDDYSKKTHASWKNKLLELEGFSDISADSFLESLPMFQKLNQKVKSLVTVKKHINKINTKGTWAGQTVVFTGFREDKWKEIIEKEGGKVSGSVSSKTSLLVFKDGETTSAKYLQAVKLGIKTVAKSKFQNKFK